MAFGTQLSARILVRNIPRRVGAELIESKSEPDWSVPLTAEPFLCAI
jgi:hypothetical protein